MPESSVKAANKLSEELHRKGRRDNVKNALLALLGLAVLAMATIGTVNIIDGRADNDRRSAERKAQIDQVAAIARRIEAVTDPNGCVAKRNQANTARVLLLIDNSNRAIHGLAPNPIPDEDTTLCPGDPGGPPLVETTTTTRPGRRSLVPKRTAATSSTYAAGSGSGR